MLLTVAKWNEGSELLIPFYVTQKGERVKAERDFWIWRKKTEGVQYR